MEVEREGGNVNLGFISVLLLYLSYAFLLGNFKHDLYV